MTSEGLNTKGMTKQMKDPGCFLKQNVSLKLNNAI